MPPIIRPGRVFISTAQYAAIMRILHLARKIVEICYSQDGAWIGTENIKAHGEFTRLVHDLGVALGMFREPT